MYLVTGATGFIGSHLVESLLAERKLVRCLLRKQSTLANLTSSLIEIVTGDLETGEGLDAAFHGVDTVFHLAGAIKAVSAKAYYAGNARTAENAVRAAWKARVSRFVHVSSIAAAGPSTGQNVLTEDSPEEPLSDYGHSKLAGERIVRASELGPKAVIIRPSAVYGPRDHDLYRFFRAIRRGRLLQVGKRECRFHLIYVKDLVEVLHHVACSSNTLGKTYFVAHSESTSWTELGSMAAKIMDTRARTVRLPVGPLLMLAAFSEGWSRLRGRPNILNRGQIRESAHDWLCSTSALARDTGFTPKWPLFLGLTETLHWYRNAGWLSY